MCVGLTSEMLSRTYYESQKKPIYVTRTTRSSDVDLGFRGEVAGRVEEDSGNHSENHANPSPLPAQSRRERPILMVSAHQPRLVRKIPRNDWA